MDLVREDIVLCLCLFLSLGLWSIYPALPSRQTLHRGRFESLTVHLGAV
jgi:hypothetical protein